MGKPVWSDSNPETLSAFMDGELPDDAHGQLLKVLETDPELRHRWSRYHLLSDAIRNNLPPALSPDLGARIHQALESEPIYLLPRQHPARPADRAGTAKEPGARVLRHAARQAGGWALAASVTAATILGVQAFNSGPAPSGATLAGAGDGAPHSTSRLAPDASPLLTMTNYPPARASNLPSPRLMDKFNHMLANHNAYVAGTPVQGVPSYVRLVNFESGR